MQEWEKQAWKEEAVEDAAILAIVAMLAFWLISMIFLSGYVLVASKMILAPLMKGAHYVHLGR